MASYMPGAICYRKDVSSVLSMTLKQTKAFISTVSATCMCVYTLHVYKVTFLINVYEVFIIGHSFLCVLVAQETNLA